MLDGPFGIPNQALQPTFLRQSGGYWSASGSINVTNVTWTRAPIYTVVVFMSADSGNNYGEAYTYSGNGNYKYVQVGTYRVSRDYPIIQVWVGNPTTPGLSGGTSVVFSHNSNAAYTSAAYWEFDRFLKGEAITNWTGWGNSTALSGSTYGNIFTAPMERSVYIAGAVCSSGGAGPSGSSSYFPRGDLVASGGLLTAGWCPTVPRQVFTPFSIATGPNTSWSGMGMFIR